MFKGPVREVQAGKDRVAHRSKGAGLWSSMTKSRSKKPSD